MKPLDATAIPAEASDEQLVARAQGGSSEAFAVLFRRYRPAIARYAGRILGDDARAEDIVQEVFLSALRSIDSLGRPAGFKPWLYRIAHNTCVDHVRRSRRAEEVSIDAQVLPQSDEIRLFRQAPSTHAAVTLKEDFKNLREAFGGLPPSQSEVLVMRELEGLSYEEIASRMGVTRASVESMLFRARQGLRTEYGQIATGERCLRMRPVMARMAEGIGGLRDRRALARHVRGCQTCRRDAYAMGLGGSALESPATGLRGGLSRVAALLPLPWLIHRRGDETGAASSAGGGGGAFATQAQTAITHLSSSVGLGADQAATAIHKAVAVVAAVAVVGGGGIVASKSDTPDLLLKPDSSAVPARADISPAVPPALLPIGPQKPAATAGAPAVAGAAVTPAAAGGVTPTAAPAPLAGAAPIVTPGSSGPVAAPKDQAAPPAGGGGGSAPGTSAPESPSGSGPSVPAAGNDGSAGSGTGSTDAGAGAGTGAGDGASSGGGGGDAGGAGTTDPPGTGSLPPGTGTKGPPCDDLPFGLAKKDKLPPGHAKRCAALEAAGATP